ncbi:MAG: alpha/beta hydrolase [Spirochaeta sp.]|jgi:pimeloyl-ACP methyl ester carboxylesterase|nr:alpha/beta hydrolase [Spirochaeta sp.]
MKPTHNYSFVRPIGLVAVLGMTLIALGSVVGCAATPPITDNAGDPVLDAIATREMVTIDGRDHGLVIRGHDRTAPILLYLAGGPAGTEIGWTTEYLAALERDVVFVNWDQPGAGMSYRSADWGSVRVSDYVDDTIALTEYLQNRFDQEQVVLVGHSWGTIVGLKAVARRPDLFSAYVGVAQQVNTRENDVHGYRYALNEAGRRGDMRVVKRLWEMGPPPYSQADGNQYEYLFQKVHAYSPHPSAEPSFTRMVFPPEYTLVNSFHAIRGLLRGVRTIYPQLHTLDFERDVPAVGVPTFFFTGRYDENCVQDFTWRYFTALEAPHKEFIWFERSGHNVPYHEPERFVREIRRRVLAPIE